MIFWTKFTQKRYSQSKSEKINTTSELCIFKSVYIPNISFSWEFWFSGPSLSKKSVSRENWTKSERHEFLIFEISRCQTSASRIKVASRGFPSQKQKKWTKQNTELSMFKLVLVPNFSLNWQFWFFGSNLRKEGISSWKQKKIYPTIKCCILK